MMVAIPELDGATGSMVFGGRGSARTSPAPAARTRCTFENVVDAHDMHSCIERADMLAARVGRLVDLRRSERGRAQGRGRRLQLPAECRQHRHRRLPVGVRVAVQHAGGDAARAATRSSCRPASTRCASASSTATPQRFGATANVHARIPADDHVRRETHLKEIEAQWGPAPGRQQSDGSRIFVLGERFGNVFVGIQPAFGYEGDPMRLLFEKGFAPTHAFSAFYRWLREDFGADAVLHFGTHGALEFMPGKQTGLSAACWPDRLIGDLPNFYLYASNNPSEGTIAKRRAAATLISYLTPPVAQAGLYKGLVDLKAIARALPRPGARSARRAPTNSRADDPGAGRRLDLARRRAGVGRDADAAAIAQAARRGARARVHADPARPARRRPGAAAPPSGSTCCCRAPRRRTACGRSARWSRRWSAAQPGSSRMLAHAPMAADASRCLLRSSPPSTR